MSLLQLLDDVVTLVERFTVPIETEASGKVLLTGGYLVLFPEYRGISIALNCQFHAIITVYNRPNTIHIICPQWLQKRLTYNISAHCRVTAHKNQLKNLFIQTSLQCFMKFLYETHASQLLLFKTFGIEITLYGDDAFYNNSDDNKDIKKEKKMGLGSSAALTVSLFKCLFKFFNVRIENNESELHNLCQLSHFISQGKIGSGFDIATSLFGCILFRRSTLNINKSQFQVAFLDKLSSEFSNDCRQHSVNIISIKTVLNCMEMCKLDLFKLPPYICIIMAVPISSFGSKTPKMVSKVLKWKENKKRECELLWDNLNESNERILAIFELLHGEYDTIGENKYIEIMEGFCNGEYEKNNEICNQLGKLKRTLKQIRQYQQQMGELSEVNIVPKIMDSILSNTQQSIDCVIEGGIPGAGGFDAIFILCIGTKQNVIKKLRTASVWPSLNMQILNV